jgi:thiol-disulfide isomerase/thioredoxin
MRTIARRFVPTCLLACLFLGGPSLAADDPAALAEGWSQHHDVEALVDPDGQVVLGAVRYTLRVEQGWLIVRREVNDGDREWEIVLARASDPEPPRIVANTAMAQVAIAYRDCFVREDAGMLRVLRERKSPQSPPWPVLAVIPDGGFGARTQNETHLLRSWNQDEWFYVGVGPIGAPVDAVLRLEHQEVSRAVAAGGRGQILTGSVGQRTVQDDGELLMADRSLAEEAAWTVLAQRRRRALTEEPAPDLDFAAWHNQADAPSLAALRGQVVLLDFWGTWCPPCVASMPRVQALHEAFAARGLAVLGVHTRMASETVAAFLQERGITFPVVVDTDRTAERFAVTSYPTYFLLDRQGKLAWGFEHSPPTDSLIEELLARP